MVNERGRKAQNKEITNTGGRSYVPGFQGRTGDAKNNKNIERLELLFNWQVFQHAVFIAYLCKDLPMKIISLVFKKHFIIVTQCVFGDTHWMFLFTSPAGKIILTRYLLAPICSTWNRFGHLHFAT